MQWRNVIMIFSILFLCSILPSFNSEMSTEIVKIFDFNTGSFIPEDWWESSDTVRYKDLEHSNF